jgi:hypothetical protein
MDEGAHIGQLIGGVGGGGLLTYVAGMVMGKK